MKTIRLLYPDYLSGGLETYYFGAHLLAHILPQNENQPLYKVELALPDGRERPVTDGVCARDEVTAGIMQAARVIEEAKPDPDHHYRRKLHRLPGPLRLPARALRQPGDSLDRRPPGRVHPRRRLPQRPRHGAGLPHGPRRRGPLRSHEEQEIQTR